MNEAAAAIPSEKASVLVIDEDRECVALIRQTLSGIGYDVIAAAGCEAGLEIALRHKPDLVILEVKIPKMGGLEVVRRLRCDERSAAIPIILVTSLGKEVDRIVGLEMGADDYVVKPFSPRELAARVRAVLRRAWSAFFPGATLRHGDLSLDCGRREVSYRGEPIPATAIELRILECLMRHPGRVLSRSDLLRSVHSDDVAVADRTIDVHMRMIRFKLGSGAKIIETVRGFGYRLREVGRPHAVPSVRVPAKVRRLATTP